MATTKVNKSKKDLNVGFTNEIYKVIQVGRSFAMLTTDDKTFTKVAGVTKARMKNALADNKAIQGFIKAAANLKIFAQTNELTFIQQGLLNHGIVKYIVLSISQDVSIRSFGRFIATVDKLKAKGFSQLSTSGVRGSYRTYATWYNISPYFFFVQYAKEIVLKRIRLGMS